MAELARMLIAHQSVSTLQLLGRWRIRGTRFIEQRIETEWDKTLPLVAGPASETLADRRTITISTHTVGLRPSQLCPIGTARCNLGTEMGFYLYKCLLCGQIESVERR
jgi:hypothetical protein